MDTVKDTTSPTVGTIYGPGQWVLQRTVGTIYGPGHPAAPCPLCPAANLPLICPHFLVLAILKYRDNLTTSAVQYTSALQYKTVQCNSFYFRATDTFH